MGNNWLFSIQGENMTKQARFIELCNALHQHLKRKHVDYEGFDTFEKHLEIEENLGNNPIHLNKHKMAVARRLRNLMVHESVENFHVAEPSDDMMTFMTTIVDQYESAMTVKDFLNHIQAEDVWYLKADSPLEQVLRDIHAKKYARFPVFGNEWQLMGILSTNGITKFIASQVANGTPFENVLNTSVQTVLQFDEHALEYAIVHEKQSIFELGDTFEGLKNDNVMIRVCLVVKEPIIQVKHPSQLIGMVTQHDLPAMYEIMLANR